MNTSSLLIVQKLNAIGNICLFYSGIFNSIIGMVGNISMILIFTTLRTFKGNQSAFYLTIESMSNIGFLLVINISRFLANILDYDPYEKLISWCKIRAMLSQLFGVCSLFTICSLAFDQYLSTNLRSDWRKMSTLKLAHQITCFVICFAIFHSITFLIFSEIQPSKGCAIYNPIIKSYYSFIYYPIITSLLPIFITLTSSLLAYHNVRRIVRRQLTIVRRRLDRQMTAMTLARVVSFIACGVPFICVSLYELNLNTNENNYTGLAIVTLLSSIFYSLLYTNFQVN